MKRKHTPMPAALTPDAILTHIGIRLKTLGDKTHGPQYGHEDKARASHGIRELVKLQKWITDHMGDSGMDAIDAATGEGRR